MWMRRRHFVGLVSLLLVVGACGNGSAGDRADGASEVAGSVAGTPASSVPPAGSYRQEGEPAFGRTCLEASNGTQPDGSDYSFEDFVGQVRTWYLLGDASMIIVGHRQAFVGSEVVSIEFVAAMPLGGAPPGPGELFAAPGMVDAIVTNRQGGADVYVGVDTEDALVDLAFVADGETGVADLLVPCDVHLRWTAALTAFNLDQQRRGGDRTDLQRLRTLTGIDPDDGALLDELREFLTAGDPGDNEIGEIGATPNPPDPDDHGDSELNSRDLATMVLAAQAIVTGSIDPGPTDPDPFPGEQLHLATITIESIDLAADPGTLQRPLREPTDLDLAVGQTLAVYLPVDDIHHDDVIAIAGESSDLAFVLFYHNLSGSPWSPWQVNAIARRGPGGLEIVHPFPPDSLTADLAAVAEAMGVDRESALTGLVSELRSGFASAEADGPDRVPGPHQLAVIARRAAIAEN